MSGRPYKSILSAVTIKVNVTIVFGGEIKTTQFDLFFVSVSKWF